MEHFEMLANSRISFTDGLSINAKDYLELSIILVSLN